MNDVPNYLAFGAGVVYILWAVAAISRRVNRHYAKPGEGQ